MVEILSILHHYVPQVEYEEQVYIPDIDEISMVHKARTHNIFLGDDQLPRVRATSSLKVKCNGETPSMRLEGLLPTIEDWHAKMTLLEVSRYSIEQL
jgi:L1 cell adhesion molecule like protein